MNEKYKELLHAYLGDNIEAARQQVHNVCSRVVAEVEAANHAIDHCGVAIRNHNEATHCIGDKLRFAEAKLQLYLDNPDVGKPTARCMLRLLEELEAETQASNRKHTELADLKARKKQLEEEIERSDLVKQARADTAAAVQGLREYYRNRAG